MSMDLPTGSAYFVAGREWHSPLRQRNIWRQISKPICQAARGR